MALFSSSIVVRTGSSSSAESCRWICDQIRNHDILKLNKTLLFHPKSNFEQWDLFVYAGIVERIDNYFLWIDTHWRVGKHDLLSRVKDWNEALEKYCDDNVIRGDERDGIIKVHKASALAPCANVNCNNVEERVKQYATCACKTVGYCSVR